MIHWFYERGPEASTVPVAFKSFIEEICCFDKIRKKNIFNCKFFHFFGLDPDTQDWNKIGKFVL
jgi:hypothetical protein